MSKTSSDFDKRHLRDALIALEHQAIDAARSKTDQAVQSARIDRTIPVEHQAHADATTSAQLAAQWQSHLKEHEAHMALLQSIDFAPTDAIDRGAVVNAGGRWMVLAVPTETFDFSGRSLIGISCEAPLAKAMYGLRAGDTYTFNGDVVRIDAVH